MTQIRTPEGFQNLGTQAAFTQNGEIPVGTRYASMDAVAATGLKLPPATATVTVAVSSSVMVLRSGPTDVRVIEF